MREQAEDRTLDLKRFINKLTKDSKMEYTIMRPVDAVKELDTNPGEG